MKEVNKTLYIPLYGKAYVSKLNLFYHDTQAEYIWEKNVFPLQKKSKSKYLAYYMAMRSQVFDDWTSKQIQTFESCIVLHLGCGLDSRCFRVPHTCHWYDVDFESVILERKKHFQESENYTMIAQDLTILEPACYFPGNTNAIVLLEGVSMYLNEDALLSLFTRLSSHFNQVSILMDVYSEFAAKASKFKNPINDVGVHNVYGYDDPTLFDTTNIKFKQELDMTPISYCRRLPRKDQKIFITLYAGKTAHKLYHLYEFKKEESQ